uniref:Matrin 3-like 1.1 n=1 Tax=Astyanax mexicanus TaxID=7994 RepID=A0A8B9LEI4_ASTMX
MSQRLTPDGGQKGFAVGRGLLAAAETLNYNMGESNPDPYSSTSQHIGGMVGLGGGDRQDHGSQLPSRVGSHLSNTMKLFASLGLSPADLDALAQIPEENISVETLPHLIMQLKNRKNLSGDLPSLFSETSYREGRDDWGDMQGGRLDRSSAHSQSRTSQGSFGYSSMQDVSAHGYDMLEYGNSSRDRQHSDLSSDRYYGLSSSSTSDDRFMQRRMGAPSQGKIQDFLGVMPQMFPHVCALCDFDVHSTMEWNQHTTGMRHAENRRVLLQLYPDWDPQMPSGRMSESFSFESRGRSDGLLAEYPSGGVRQRTGMSSNWGIFFSIWCVYIFFYLVVNVVGFRRGYNYLDEILSLAKPFGTVVRHLVLNVRPEAFVELASEEEARAMVRFYNGNVTPTVCGKEVKIFHSHVYATIQVSRIEKKYSFKVVYIGRLPPFKSDASLLKIAEPFGKIRCYYINKVRNECFIEMERAEDAERLVETAKTSTIKFEGKKLVVYLSRKYKHLEKGLRPPAPEPEEKRPPKRERSEELSEAQVSSPVKTKTSKKEEPPTKKVKEETSCTEDTQDGPAEKQAETSESEAEMKIQKTEENSSDAAEAYNFKTTTTCENDNSAAAAALPCVVPEKSQENNEAPTLPAQSQKKTITTLDTLGPYEPDVPVGVEFVKMGYYCRVCFLFYSNEDTAKKVHCSSQAHYDKLKKHLAKEKAKAQSDEEKN